MDRVWLNLEAVFQQGDVFSNPLLFPSLFSPLIGQNLEVTFGAPKDTPGSVTVVFYRVFEACMLFPANPQLKRAYAHYFGCGMHLLHLIPVQGPPVLSRALNR